MPPEWVSMTEGSSWPPGNAAENLREVRVAQGGGWRVEHSPLLSIADLDVQKEKTSFDLTSTHHLREELKTRWESGSPAAFSGPISTSLIVIFSRLQMTQLLSQTRSRCLPTDKFASEEWTLRVMWSVGRPHKLLSLNLGLVVQSKAGGELVWNYRLVALVVPSSPCDISLVRWTQPDLGPAALGSPVDSPVWHTSHTSLSAISHSELNIT